MSSRRASSGSTSPPTRSRPTPRNRTAPIAWDHTTLVVVEATAGGVTGLGYSYADTATAALIRDLLAKVVRGPRRDGGAGCLVGDGRGHPQPRPARDRLDGDLGRRRGALGPEGAAARPAPGHSPRRGPRRRAGLRQRRVHVVFDRAAPASSSAAGSPPASRGSR